MPPDETRAERIFVALRKRATRSTGQDRRFSMNASSLITMPGGAHRRPTACEKIFSRTAHSMQISFLHAFETLDGTSVLTISRDTTMIVWKHVEDEHGAVMRPIRVLKGHKFPPQSFAVGETPTVVFTGGQQQVIEWHLHEKGDNALKRRMHLPKEALVEETAITALVCFNKETDFRVGWLAAGLDRGDVYIFADDAITPFMHVRQELELTRGNVVPNSLTVSSTGLYLYGAAEDVAFKINMPDKLENMPDKLDELDEALSNSASAQMVDMLPNATSHCITAMSAGYVNNGTLQLLVAGSVTSNVYVWDPALQEPLILFDQAINTVDKRHGAVTCVELIDRGEKGHVIVATMDGQLRCYDIASCTMTSSIQMEGDTFVTEVFVIDGNRSQNHEVGEQVLICGSTTRQAFLWAPLLINEVDVDVSNLVSMYRRNLFREASAYVPDQKMELGTHSWLQGSSTQRCLVFTGLRGSVCAVVVTSSAIMCGTSYGGVGSWVRHTAHHDDLLAHGSSSLQGIERRQLNDQDQRARVSHGGSSRRLSRSRSRASSS